MAQNCMRVIAVAVGAGALTIKAMTSLVHGQAQIGQAPPGPAEAVAATAIRDADRPCGAVFDAICLDSGRIRATCSSGETYRVFTVQGKVVAMRCSAVAKLGVSDC
jgi:hypothetical protein